jgi:hypothetical protein
MSAPDRIRTCDLRFRRPTLYPAELRALGLRVARVARGLAAALPAVEVNGDPLVLVHRSREDRRSWQFVVDEPAR